MAEGLMVAIKEVLAGIIGLYSTFLDFIIQYGILLY